jgi:nicotinamidase-related amidase
MTSPLIIIDVQNGFINENSHQVVSRIVSFAENRLAIGGRVIASRFINEPGSQWEKLMHWTRLREAPEIDLAPSLLNLAEVNPQMQVVDKKIYSSLTSEVMSSISAGSDSEVLLCGIATESCVLKTAVDLFERGFRPIVLSDLCASHAGHTVHEAGLMVLGRFIGSEQVMRSEEYSD